MDSLARLRAAGVRFLTGLGLKQPVKVGLNRLLAFAGQPPVGDPRAFRDLERLARTPRPRPDVTRGRVLFIVTRGWTASTALHTMFGEAVAQRGYEPTFFTCGGPLPLCGIATNQHPDPTPCRDCFDYTSRHFEALRFPYHRLDDLVDAADRERARELAASIPDDQLTRFEHSGFPLGRMVRVSLLYYLVRGTPGPDFHSACRRFLESAVLYVSAYERLLDRVRPDRILIHNGLHFDGQIMRAMAKAKGIEFVTDEAGWPPDTWLFKRGDVACKFLVRDEFRELGRAPLTPREARRVRDYFDARRNGRADVARYWPSIETDPDNVVAELGIDRSRPIVSLFTNISWDTAIIDRDLAFDGMFDWLEETVRLFAKRDDAQLVVRVHPAEVRLGLKTRDGVIGTLTERMGEIPASVCVVPPESKLSSYTLADLSRFSIVYTSTLGLELAVQGKVVVVAGDVHYGELGFTIDADDRAEYPALIGRLIREPLPEIDGDVAYRYGHFFLYRYSIPLPFVDRLEDGHVRFRLRSLDELGPGRDPNLDLVMDGLLGDGRFFLPSSTSA